MTPQDALPMHRCAARAERCRPGFVAEASACILALLARGPQPGEMLVDLCKLRGIDTGEDRAFGAVFRILSQGKRIKPVGYCERRKGHHTAGGRVWALV